MNGNGKIHVLKADTHKQQREHVITTLKDAIKEVENNVELDSVYIIMTNRGSSVQSKNQTFYINRFWAGTSNDLEVLGTLEIVKKQHMEYMRELE